MCREARTAEDIAAEPVAARHARAVARPDLPGLDADVQLTANVLGDRAQIDALLARVPNHDAAAIEGHFGAVHLDALMTLDDLAPEDTTHFGRTVALLAAQCVVVGRALAQDAEDALGHLALVLVRGLHDAAVLLAARRLADHAIVPCELVAVGIKRLDLAAGLEYDTDDDHAVTTSRRRARPTRA